jgi:ATP-dependent DNA helicase RecG
MLNSRVGRVVFGVTEDGSPAGVELSDASVRDVVDELRRIEPAASTHVDRFDVGAGRQLLVVEGRPGNRGPYTYRGVPYRRVGTSTLEIPRDEFERLIVERHHAGERWELGETRDFTTADLDEVEVVRTLEEAVRRGRALDPGTRNVEDVLRGLGLLRDDRLTRGAVVLFARSDTLAGRMPQCKVRPARFKGTDRSEFLDNRQVEGNLFELLRESELFIQRHNPVAGKIVPNLLERLDEPLYPPIATREALANALCHREYELASGSVGGGHLRRSLGDQQPWWSALRSNPGGSVAAP